MSGIITNNHLESLNGRLKSVCKAQDTLPKFVSGYLVLNTIRADRNAEMHSAISKRPTTSCHCELCDYERHVTPFALSLIREELELAGWASLGVATGGRWTACDCSGHVDVSPTGCGCMFYRQYCMPCRHIFAVRRQLSMSLFSQDLIGNKWLLSYAADHLQAQVVPCTVPTACVSSCPLPQAATPRTDRQRFRKLQTITSQIASVGSELSGREHEDLAKKLTLVLECLQGGRSFVIAEELDATMADDPDADTQYAGARTCGDDRMSSAVDGPYFGLPSFLLDDELPSSLVHPHPEPKVSVSGSLQQCDSHILPTGLETYHSAVAATSPPQRTSPGQAAHSITGCLLQSTAPASFSDNSICRTVVLTQLPQGTSARQPVPRRKVQIQSPQGTPAEQPVRRTILLTKSPQRTSTGQPIHRNVVPTQSPQGTLAGQPIHHTVVLAQSPQGKSAGQPVRRSIVIIQSPQGTSTGQSIRRTASQPPQSSTPTRLSGSGIGKAAAQSASVENFRGVLGPAVAHTALPPPSNSDTASADHFLAPSCTAFDMVRRARRNLWAPKPSPVIGTHLSSPTPSPIIGGVRRVPISSSAPSPVIGAHMPRTNSVCSPIVSSPVIGKHNERPNTSVAPVSAATTAVAHVPFSGRSAGDTGHLTNIDGGSLMLDHLTMPPRVKKNRGRPKGSVTTVVGARRQ